MCKVVGFYNRKGGCGKTTAMFNIASEIAFTYKKKILLIDGDSQCNLTDLIDEEGNEDELNLYSLLTETPVKNDKILKAEYSFAKRVNNTYKTNTFTMDLIKGSEDLDYLEVTEIEILKEKLARFHDSYDYIFIDFPPGNTFNTMMYLVACDYVIAPMNLAKDNTTKAYIKLIDKCKEAREEYGNTDLTILGAFYTGVQLYKADQKQVYEMTKGEEFKPLRLFDSTIRFDYKSVQLSESFMRPIMVVNSSAPIIDDIRSLAKEIMGRLEGK